MAAASVSLSRAAKLRKRVILSAPTRRSCNGDGPVRKPPDLAVWFRYGTRDRQKRCPSGPAPFDSFRGRNPAAQTGPAAGFSPVQSGDSFMPIRQFLDNPTFDPEATRVMGVAFEMVRAALGLAGRGDLANEIVAQRIIELAKTGERNPDLLCEGALKKLHEHLYSD